MKTRTLASVLILICWFVLSPSLLRAQENDWYQGQQGQWRRDGNSWRWESTHGDEWYQGRQGHWYQERDGWQWYGNDGSEYRQGSNGWQWYGGRDRNETTGNAASRWNRFLEQNPDFARRFHGNPDIIRDQRVMDDQPGVREFFTNNPDVRDYVYRSTRNDHGADDTPSAKWNRFLDHNPNFAARYRQNPDIIHNENVMRDEPEVREFLRTNPEVRGYVYNGGGVNPSRSGRDANADEDMRADSGFDAYLANHPNLARQLHDNPSLINDHDFVRSHPKLHEYLRNHPETRY